MSKKLTSIFTAAALATAGAMTAPVQAKNDDGKYQCDTKVTETGEASWYGRPFHGRYAANYPERYNMYAMTAAHKTLPFNTVVKVTRKDTGKSVIVRINDRGPFIPGRIIDLSKKAADDLKMLVKGTADVELRLCHKPK